MNESRIRREVKRIQKAIDREVAFWEKTLESEPEALLGPSVSQLLNALRGYDSSAAEERSWMLSV